MPPAVLCTRQIKAALIAAVLSRSTTAAIAVCSVRCTSTLPAVLFARRTQTVVCATSQRSRTAAFSAACYVRCTSTAFVVLSQTRNRIAANATSIFVCCNRCTSIHLDVLFSCCTQSEFCAAAQFNQNAVYNTTCDVWHMYNHGPTIDACSVQYTSTHLAVLLTCCTWAVFGTTAQHCNNATFDAAGSVR